MAMETLARSDSALLFEKTLPVVFELRSCELILPTGYIQSGGTLKLGDDEITLSSDMPYGPFYRLLKSRALQSGTVPPLQWGERYFGGPLVYMPDGTSAFLRGVDWEAEKSLVMRTQGLKLHFVLAVVGPEHWTAQYARDHRDEIERATAMFGRRKVGKGKSRVADVIMRGWRFLRR